MSPARILVIEDDATLRRLVVTVLKLDGYDVAEAANAEAGCARIAERTPDIVLMDRQLPGMDGLTMTRVLKSDARTRTVTVLAFTGSASRQDDMEAVRAGCDGFVAKPFDVPELLRTVAWHVAVRDSRFGARRLVHRVYDEASFVRPLGAAQSRAARIRAAI